MVDDASQDEVAMGADSVGYPGTVLWAVNGLVESTVNGRAAHAAVRVHLRDPE